MPPDITIASLTAQVKELEKENDRLRKENSEIDKTIEVLRKMLGAPDTSLSGLTGALHKHDVEVASNAKRGKPKCAEANTLVRVEALDGKMEVFINGPDEVLRQIGLSWHQNDRLDELQVNELFQQVDRYSREDGCKFDYRLSYGTPVDYYNARTRFEGHFYPENIVPRVDH